MKMPDLATTDSDIRLLRWFCQPGQAVKRGQPLFEVETDKAISQVESIATGILKEVRAQADSLVSAGQVIAVLELQQRQDALPDISTTDAAHFSASAIKLPATARSAAAEAILGRSSEPAREKPQPPTPQPQPPAPAPTYERPFLLSLYERMVLIREFEERVKFLFLEGAMPGTIHQCQGHARSQRDAACDDGNHGHHSLIHVTDVH